MTRHSKDYDDAYELRRGAYSEDYSQSRYNEDGADERLLTEGGQIYTKQTSLIQKIFRIIALRTRRRRGRHAQFSGICSIVRPASFRKSLSTLTSVLFILLAVTALFFPSYTHPPLRYDALRDLAEKSESPARGNLRKEKVFIAASIFDRTGGLAGGQWGQSILKLIDLLGPQNVYLSIYENDAGVEGKHALKALEAQVTCSHSIVFEDHLSLNNIPHVTLPDGSQRYKRIEYLAEVRNRALAPLKNSATRFDKLLYLNDVVFDPIEALQLLFSTNADETGRTEYRAACAVDFINPFKYYDTFATRDIEGYSIGLPFFPFFTSAGNGFSRREVLAGQDNVRVRSCWGGMVAFDARFFQPQPNPANVPVTAAAESPSNVTAPYTFRAESDLYWDASECCLIHADIQDPDPEYSGIFLNPYIRVAYDSRTLSWLHFTRKFEKLYSPLHWLITKIIGMPWYNPRRAEKPYQKVQEKVWVAQPDSPYGGAFEMTERLATHSGFCGRRALQVLKTDITEGEKNWEFLPLPS